MKAPTRFNAEGDEIREIVSIRLFVKHDGFMRNGLNLFDIKHDVTIKFDDFQFSVGDNFKFKRTYMYSQLPSENGMGLMVSEMMRVVMDEIKKKSGNSIS